MSCITAGRRSSKAVMCNVKRKTPWIPKNEPCAKQGFCFFRFCSAYAAYKKAAFQISGRLPNYFIFASLLSMISFAQATAAWISASVTEAFLNRPLFTQCRKVCRNMHAVCLERLGNFLKTGDIALAVNHIKATFLPEPVSGPYRMLRPVFPDGRTSQRR